MIIRNQVIAPRRGNELLAQGIALGNERRSKRPERAKALTVGMLLPFQGEHHLLYIPRAMPWASGLLAFQAAYRVHADNHLAEFFPFYS